MIPLLRRDFYRKEPDIEDFFGQWCAFCGFYYFIGVLKIEWIKKSVGKDILPDKEEACLIGDKCLF